MDETTPGTGLGLNIVSEMAHSYREALALGESQLGGLKATLTLKQPLAQPKPSNPIKCGAKTDFQLPERAMNASIRARF